jgi:Kef-type K+ transport system membrane component KefB
VIVPDCADIAAKGVAEEAAAVVIGVSAVHFTNLLIVAALAFAAPFLLGLAPRLRLPAVVLEILAGIVVGPSGLGWVNVDQPVSILSLLGLSFLLFLAGMEIDIKRLRGQALRLTALIASDRRSRGARVPCRGAGALAAVHRDRPRLDLARGDRPQIRVRGAFVLLVGFVALAGQVGFETILGAFAAGALLSLVDRDEAMTHPQLRLKLEAAGFGFFIPMFFITSGLRFDLNALFSSASTIARVPLFLLALVAVRGVPALFYGRLLARRQQVAAGLLQATSLPVIVAAMIGQELGVVSRPTAAGLIAAGMLSVIAFPLAGLALLRGSGERVAHLMPTPATPVLGVEGRALCLSAMDAR